MKSHLRRIAVALFAFPLSLAATAPASKPDVRLWRLDCGSLFTLNLDELSDTRA
jgi:N-acyl homoserine lactone hydrolase